MLYVKFRQCRQHCFLFPTTLYPERPGGRPFRIPRLFLHPLYSWLGVWPRFHVHRKVCLICCLCRSQLTTRSHRKLARCCCGIELFEAAAADKAIPSARECDGPPHKHHLGITVGRQDRKVLPVDRSEDEHLLGTIGENPPCGYCQLPVLRTPYKVMSSNPARSKTTLSLSERVVERHEPMQRQGFNDPHKLSERDGHCPDQLSAVGSFDYDERVRYCTGISLNRRPSRPPI